MVEEKPANRTSSSVMRLAGMGLELAGAVGVFSLIGYWIDRQMENRRPWALVICALLGVVGGLYNMIRRALHESLGIKPPGERPDRGGPVRRDRPPEAPKNER